MAKKGLTMAAVGSMAIGVLILIVVYSIIPLVGENIDTAITLGATSQWNSSVNSNIPTGPSTWTTLAPLLTLAAIVLVVGGFLGTLKGIRG